MFRLIDYSFITMTQYGNFYLTCCTITLSSSNIPFEREKINLARLLIRIGNQKSFDSGNMTDCHVSLLSGWKRLTAPGHAPYPAPRSQPLQGLRWRAGGTWINPALEFGSVNFPPIESPYHRWPKIKSSPLYANSIIMITNTGCRTINTISVCVYPPLVV